MLSSVSIFRPAIIWEPTDDKVVMQDYKKGFMRIALQFSPSYLNWLETPSSVWLTSLSILHFRKRRLRVAYWLKYSATTKWTFVPKGSKCNRNSSVSPYEYVQRSKLLEYQFDSNKETELFREVMFMCYGLLLIWKVRVVTLNIKWYI
jgi:hypothetical protein